MFSPLPSSKRKSTTAVPRRIAQAQRQPPTPGRKAVTPHPKLTKGPAQKVLSNPTSTSSSSASHNAGPSQVKVLVRVRPRLQDEGSREEMVMEVDDKGQTMTTRHMGRDYTIEVDKVLKASTTQEELYQVGGFVQAVEAVFTGRHTCIFAYGSTGSGKSHTMKGGSQPHLQGVTPRALKQVFTKADAMNKANPGAAKVVMSYMELHMDRLRDLLVPAKDQKDLPIREDGGGSINVPGLTEITLNGYEDFEKAFEAASTARKTCHTLSNVQSSRSHAIVTVKVICRRDEGPTASSSFSSGSSTQQQSQQGSGVMVGKLQLIDLAGSERNGKTGNTGERLQESQNINLSLLALGKVIDGLRNGDTRISYRDSKLTRLLQDSLGDPANRVYMVCCVAPFVDVASETCQSLTYAAKARLITNRPKPLHASSSEYMGTQAFFGTGKADPTRRSSVKPSTLSKGPPDSTVKVGDKRKHPPTNEKENALDQHPSKASKKTADGDKGAALQKKPEETGLADKCEKVEQVKDLLVQAKSCEKANNLAEALQLYQRAHTLLPDHPKLQAKLTALQDRMQNATSDAGLDESIRLSSLSTSMSSAPVDAPLGPDTDMMMDDGEVMDSSNDDQQEEGGDNGAPMAVEGTEEDEAGAEGKEGGAEVNKEECIQQLHQEIRNVVEREIVDILNTGTKKDLMALHGIGKKRAEDIIKLREAGSFFRELQDLRQIGLSSNIINGIQKSNLSGRLCDDNK